MGGYFPGDYWGTGTGTEGSGSSILETSSQYLAVTWRSADGETLTIPGYFSDGYLIRGLEGCMTPPAELVEERSPFQDGSTSLRSDVQARTISFELELFGSSRGELEARKKFIGRIFSARTRAGEKNVGTFSITLSDQTVYSIFAVPIQIDDSGSSHPSWFGFGIELFAEDPYWYGATHSISMIPGSGLTFPITFPLVFAGGDITVDNVGDLPVYPVIQIDGSVTNPEVTNLTTGKRIGLNVVVPSGQRLELDHRFGYKTVKFISLSDSTEVNQFDKLEVGSEFFPLVAGVNRMRFDFDAGSAQGTLLYASRYTVAAAA